MLKGYQVYMQIGLVIKKFIRRSTSSRGSGKILSILYPSGINDKSNKMKNIRTKPVVSEIFEYKQYLQLHI